VTIVTPKKDINVYSKVRVIFGFRILIQVRYQPNFDRTLHMFNIIRQTALPWSTLF